MSIIKNNGVSQLRSLLEVEGLLGVANNHHKSRQDVDGRLNGLDIEGALSATHSNEQSLLEMKISLSQAIRALNELQKSLEPAKVESGSKSEGGAGGSATAAAGEKPEAKSTEVKSAHEEVGILIANLQDLLAGAELAGQRYGFYKLGLSKAEKVDALMYLAAEILGQDKKVEEAYNKITALESDDDPKREDFLKELEEAVFAFETPEQKAYKVKFNDSMKLVEALKDHAEIKSDSKVKAFFQKVAAQVLHALRAVKAFFTMTDVAASINDAKEGEAFGFLAHTDGDMPAERLRLVAASMDDAALKSIAKSRVESSTSSERALGKVAQITKRAIAAPIAVMQRIIKALTPAGHDLSILPTYEGARSLKGSIDLCSMHDALITDIGGPFVERATASSLNAGQDERVGPAASAV